MILNIISIILSSIAILVSIYVYFIITESNREETTSEEDNNLDEKLNSLEFNTRLDDLIRPMLGKYTNEEITKKLTDYIINYEMKDTNESNIDIIKNYISDLLLVYNNHIEPELVNDASEEYFEDIKVSDVQQNNDFNIDNVLKDFYK